MKGQVLGESCRPAERDPHVVTAATFAWARSCWLHRVLAASQREDEGRGAEGASLSLSELNNWRDFAIKKLVRPAGRHGGTDAGQASIRKLRTDWDLMGMMSGESRSELKGPRPTLTTVQDRHVLFKE